MPIENTERRIKHIFKSIETMHENQFTDRELEIIESMESRFNQVSWLSDKSHELLEQIFRRAAER